jgi:DNA-binding CsgD family transcriptional regulator
MQVRRRERHDRHRVAHTRRASGVADLAASGHGNREIAQRLYVTRRTVETHLTHVLAKLGTSGRSELVDLFAHAAPTAHQP